MLTGPGLGSRSQISSTRKRFAGPPPPLARATIRRTATDHELRCRAATDKQLVPEGKREVRDRT